MRVGFVCTSIERCHIRLFTFSQDMQRIASTVDLEPRLLRSALLCLGLEPWHHVERIFRVFSQVVNYTAFTRLFGELRPDIKATKVKRNLRR